MSQDHESALYGGLSLPDVDAPVMQRTRSILGAGAVVRGKEEPLPHMNLVGDMGAALDETEPENEVLVEIASKLVSPPRPGQDHAAEAPIPQSPATPEAAAQKRPAGAAEPSLLLRLVPVALVAGPAAVGAEGNSYAEHVEDNQAGRDYMFVLDCVLLWWKKRLATVGRGGSIAWSCKWIEICPMIESLIDNEPDANLKEMGLKLKARWSKTKKKAQ
jgi:hypothetical protein